MEVSIAVHTAQTGSTGNTGRTSIALPDRPSTFCTSFSPPAFRERAIQLGARTIKCSDDYSTGVLYYYPGTLFLERRIALSGLEAWSAVKVLRVIGMVHVRSNEEGSIGRLLSSYREYGVVPNKT